mgnify:CR=1 FL=1
MLVLSDEDTFAPETSPVPEVSNASLSSVISLSSALLAFLAQSGVQVIVETHSDHIYNAVRKSICNDEIKCDNVSVYFFEQLSDGNTNPILIPIDDEGRAQQQRDGFFDQTKKDLQEILGW